jgi:hypothetical protein
VLLGALPLSAVLALFPVAVSGVAF